MAFQNGHDHEPASGSGNLESGEIPLPTSSFYPTNILPGTPRADPSDHSFGEEWHAIN